MDSSGTKFEIGHVLLTDIVGYSKLLISEQAELLEHLKGMARGSAEVRAAEAEGKLIRLATGDGMALIFRNNPEATAQCALELSRAAKAHPELQLRMGIHSGPIKEVSDVNERANVTGAGVNIAQRVMDCGDAGHILLSQHVADDLEQYPRWRPCLHPLGECQVKHGVRLSIVNLYDSEVGNPKLPEKFQALASRRGRRFWIAMAAALLVCAAGIAAVTLFSRKSARATPAAAEKSIAVLPFENLSANQENAFFTDGVQDEILTDLAKVADLKVISRTSVMQYKAAAPRNLSEIAQALKVANVLEGSVQRSGNRVRVSAQLIDARTDTHIWAENYDRDLSDVFAIQSEIAQAIASQLQAKLSPKESAAIDKQPTHDLAAYDPYLKAKQLRNEDILDASRLRENLLEGINLLNEAVARDPHFLLAYCLLEHAHDTLYRLFDHTQERLALADASVKAAVKLQPDAAETHLAQGRHYYLAYRDYGRARAELLQAQRGLPNDPEISELLGSIDQAQGRWDDALRNLARAVQLDPLNARPLDYLGGLYMNLRRYHDAAETYDRALALHPASSVAQFRRTWVDFDAAANLAPSRAVLNAVEKKESAAAAGLVEEAFMVALRERDPVAAERAVAEMSGQARENLPYPTAFSEAGVALLRHDAPAMRVAFLAAREQEERVVLAQPRNSESLGLLAWIDAYLGNKDKAIEEARNACALTPLAKDALEGADRMTDLAAVYAITGERQLALEELATVSKLPGGPSYGVLMLEPAFDSLRADPGFQKITASLAPK